MSDAVSSITDAAVTRLARPGRPVAVAPHVGQALRDIVEAWPGEVDRRRRGGPATPVVDPACIRPVWLDEAHRLVRDGAKGRALASGLPASGGRVGRAQGRTAAPVSRPDRIRAFIPAVARAVEATLRRPARFHARGHA